MLLHLQQSPPLIGIRMGVHFFAAIFAVYGIFIVSFLGARGAALSRDFGIIFGTDDFGSHDTCRHSNDGVTKNHNDSRKELTKGCGRCNIPITYRSQGHNRQYTLRGILVKPVSS